MHWHEMEVAKVNEIVALNKKGIKASSLEEYIDYKAMPNTELFNDVVGQDSLTRFDQPKRRRKKRRGGGSGKKATAGANKAGNQSQGSSGRNNKNRKRNRNRNRNKNA